MPGASIGTSLPFGYGGTISRQTPAPSIEAKPVADDSDNILFGQPVVLNSDNTFDAPTSTTLTAANFAGVAVAVAQQNNTYPPDNASGFFAPESMADVMQSGVIIVQVQRGTPTAGGAVYVRTQLSTESPALVIGGFEAQADGSQTVQLTNCSWNTGIVDANGMAELKVKTINN
jgi:hypothetical protein